MIDEYYTDRVISDTLNCEFSACITDDEFRKILKDESCASNIPGPNKGLISGSNNPMYGKTHSDETKDKMRAAHKTRKEYGKGRKASNIARKNMSESRRKMFGIEYHTPYGIFTSSRDQTAITPATLRYWCKNNKTIVNKNMYKRSSYLKSIGETVIGKTLKQLGFSYATV